MLSTDAILKRLNAAQNQRQLALAIESIKQSLIRSLRDTRNQAQALVQAEHLRQQLQQQIFELNNSRLHAQQRHRLEALQEIDEQLKALLPSLK